MKAEIRVVIDKDSKGTFIDHQLHFDHIPELTQRVTRAYYAKVDKLILQNMPKDILDDLARKIADEILRRQE